MSCWISFTWLTLGLLINSLLETYGKKQVGKSSVNLQRREPNQTAVFKTAIAPDTIGRTIRYVCLQNTDRQPNDSELSLENLRKFRDRRMGPW
jgi:hypothetical protein